MNSFTSPQQINLIEEHKANTGHGWPQPNTEATQMKTDDVVCWSILGFVVLIWANFKMMGVI